MHVRNKGEKYWSPNSIMVHLMFAYEPDCQIEKGASTVEGEFYSVRTFFFLNRNSVFVAVCILISIFFSACFFQSPKSRTHEPTYNLG
jgi:hypothetical protein